LKSAAVASKYALSPNVKTAPPILSTSLAVASACEPLSEALSAMSPAPTSVTTNDGCGGGWFNEG